MYAEADLKLIERPLNKDSEKFKSGGFREVGDGTFRVKGRREGRGRIHALIV